MQRYRLGGRSTRHLGDRGSCDEDVQIFAPRVSDIETSRSMRERTWSMSTWTMRCRGRWIARVPTMTVIPRECLNILSNACSQEAKLPAFARDSQSRSSVAVFGSASQR